jgi:hypothetical protein
MIQDTTDNKINIMSGIMTVDNPPLEYSDNTTTWNDNLESMVKNIGEMSKIYKMMHVHTAQRCNNMYNRYMYLSICIGPMTGLLSSVSPMFDEDTIKYVNITITFLSFFSGILATIIKFGKFDEECSANKLAASRYTTLESNVNRQLSLYRKDRISAKEYVEWLTKSYDELFLASPLVPQEISKIYIDKADKEGIKLINCKKDDDKVDKLKINFEDDLINYEMNRLLGQKKYE